MHIPDNYLSLQTDAVLAAVMVPVWVRCARVVRERLDRRHLSFLGMAAAFSFLLMMFNVPLPGGTTGHAVGGTLVALLLGPEAACLAVSVALAIQARVFGDGGLLAFGANCLNMAFVLPFVGWGVTRLVRGGSTSPTRRRVAAAVGAYVGLAVAALCAAVEFGIQPMLFSDAAGNALFCPYGLDVAVPAMMVPHLLVACVVEAVSTVAIYEFVLRCAPDLVVGEDAARPAAPASGSRGLARVAMLVGALAVATPLGLLATGDAWGEWSTEDLVANAGLAKAPAGMASGLSFESVMPDYSLAGLPDAAAYVLSALIGVALLVIIFKLVAQTAHAAPAEKCAGTDAPGGRA